MKKKIKKFLKESSNEELLEYFEEFAKRYDVFNEEHRDIYPVTKTEILKRMEAR